MKPKQSAKFDFKSESDFRDLRGCRASELETACKYEYMRESHALRVRVKKEPKPSILPYLHRIAPYRDRLSRSCKADCPRQWGLQRNKRAPNEYRIYCSHCGNAVDLPCDDWVLKFVALASRPARSASPNEASKATKLPSFCGETFTRGDTYRLVFPLRKAGFPKPWNTLEENAQKELITAIGEWEKERIKSCPPIKIEDAVPERDLEREREQLAARFPMWRFKPSEPELLRHWEQLQREYFFGFIRIDESYNETDAVKAFKKEFRKRWAKTRGGNRARWSAKLNDLVVMRFWKRFPDDPFKRVEPVAKFTTAGFKGCKECWDERRREKKAKLGFVDRRMSKAANEEMSRARADALKFFQSLFPGEKPLSY